MQILVDQNDIFINHNIISASVTVKKGVLAQFNVNNTSAWMNPLLFKVGSVLQIKAGYGGVMELIFYGVTSAVKTIFSSDCPPQMVVFGKWKQTKEPIAVNTVIPLTYGETFR